MSTDMSQESMSWGEVAELTHATQVGQFNYCTCEEMMKGDEPPYKDCPNPKFIAYDMVCPYCDGSLTQITRGEPHASCSCGGEYILITEREAQV